MRKYLKKGIICLILAMIMLLTVMPAFADTTYYINMRVYGGPSQQVYTNSRVNTDAVKVNLTSLSNLQSGFKFRGYNYVTGTVCTEMSDVITGTGEWTADYTANATIVKVLMSITSSDPTVYVKWSGSIAA